MRNFATFRSKREVMRRKVSAAYFFFHALRSCWVDCKRRDSSPVSMGFENFE